MFEFTDRMNKAQRTILTVSILFQAAVFLECQSGSISDVVFQKHQKAVDVAIAEAFPNVSRLDVRHSSHSGRLVSSGLQVVVLNGPSSSGQPGTFTDYLILNVLLTWGLLQLWRTRPESRRKAAAARPRKCRSCHKWEWDSRRTHCGKCEHPFETEGHA
jgi:hypothetical protein